MTDDIILLVGQLVPGPGAETLVRTLYWEDLSGTDFPTASSWKLPLSILMEPAQRTFLEGFKERARLSFTVLR